MSELSIFVDESGDFGSYEPLAPFYLSTLVTLELICQKDEYHILSKSEEAFLGSMKDLRKNYIKTM